MGAVALAKTSNVMSATHRLNSLRRFISIQDTAHLTVVKEPIVLTGRASVRYRSSMRPLGIALSSCMACLVFFSSTPSISASCMPRRSPSRCAGERAWT
eukprot:569170-Prymnesium_polylepis.2